jgi:hypothetical protein
MLFLAAADTLAGVASAASKLTCTISGDEINTATGADAGKVLYQGQLASSAATIYTVPATTVTVVKTITVVNTDSVSRTFQLFRGGTAAANAITGTITLPADYSALWDDNGWHVYSDQGQQLGVGATGAAGATGSDAANGQPMGLTGAVAATRYVGGTASGAPATGTFAVGDFVVTQDGSIYICTSAGSPGTWAAVSGGGASGGTPALTLGTANSAGSSGTFLRDDDTILVFDATVPVTQAYSDAAAAGSATVAARRDHKHGMPAAGSGLADEGVFTYLDGTVAAAPGTPGSGKLRVYAKTGKILAVKDDTGAETTFGSGVSLGSDTPLVESGSGSVGTAATASHEDHVHPAGGGGSVPAVQSAEGLITAYNLFR